MQYAAVPGAEVGDKGGSGLGTTTADVRQRLKIAAKRKASASGAASPASSGLAPPGQPESICKLLSKVLWQLLPSHVAREF